MTSIRMKLVHCQVGMLIQGSDLINDVEHQMILGFFVRLEDGQSNI